MVRQRMCSCSTKPTRSSNSCSFATQEQLSAASFTGIGAFSDVTLGFFERARKAYKRIPLDEQVEVLTLAGDIALKDGERQVHAHAVVGKADGSAWGGHLLEGHVWPTLELVLVESPVELRRTLDEETGLPLITLEPPRPIAGAKGIDNPICSQEKVDGNSGRRSRHSNRRGRAAAEWLRLATYLVPRSARGRDDCSAPRPASRRARPLATAPPAGRRPRGEAMDASRAGSARSVVPRRPSRSSSGSVGGDQPPS